MLHLKDIFIFFILGYLLKHGYDSCCYLIFDPCFDKVFEKTKNSKKKREREQEHDLDLKIRMPKCMANASFYRPKFRTIDLMTLLSGWSPLDLVTILIFLSPENVIANIRI